jgi:hypothetical protein
MQFRHVIAVTALALSTLANASGPQRGEYVCSKMKGTILPCTPRHLMLLEGNKWQWSAHEGTYHIRGKQIRFEGPNHGPVAWGPAHFEGDTVIFVDKKVSAIFTLSEPLR